VRGFPRIGFEVAPVIDCIGTSDSLAPVELSH